MVFERGRTNGAIQGLVTVIRPVEPFATAIKITSRDQDVNL